MRRVAAAGHIGFEAFEISFDDVIIDRLGKQQRHIDADALADQMFDRRQAFRRARHLHHQVLAADGRPQMLGFRDRCVGVARQIGRDLQRDEAVLTFGLGIERLEHIGGVLDIFDRQRFEQLGDGTVPRLKHLRDRRVILVGRADRLFEDRRVRGQAAHAVGVDQLFQIALGDETACEKIEPDCLAVRLQ